MDADSGSRLLLIGGVIAVLIIALGLIGYGYYDTVIKPRNRTVLEVDGVKVSFAAMKRRMGYEYFSNAAYQRSPQALPAGAYEALLEEIVVVTRAESDQGVTATVEEQDQKLRARVGVGDTAEQSQFADALRRQLSVTGLRESEYRRLILSELLITKLKDKFKTELPQNIAQSRIQVVATNDEATATKALDRIKAGEPWATVAGELSVEVDVATTGGIHDYTPKGGFNPAYDAFAANATIGETSGVISYAPTGQFFIVQVLDRADKPVTEDQKPKLVDARYNDWLTKLEDSAGAKNNWDQKSQTDALISVIKKQPRQAVPQQPVQVPAQPQQPQPQAPANPVDPGQGAPQVPNGPVQPGGGNVP